jgi:hypothetical protein
VPDTQLVRRIVSGISVDIGDEESGDTMREIERKAEK